FSVSFPTDAIGHLLGKWSKMRVALHALLSGFANSSVQPRPQRMFQNGRPVDNQFGRFERLYHRCVQEDMEGNRLSALRLRYENTSVNRSRYSKPWDVIFDH